ncbi:MAG TPA: alpha/beta hydrolase [Candidatus Methylacidiphilales bacterium]
MNTEIDYAVHIALPDVALEGEMALPTHARSLVVFVHGSGSSRLSPRNRMVAEVLHQAGIGTLLFDLLTLEEEAAEASTRHLRFDIPFLSRRLTGTLSWLDTTAGFSRVPLGLFGSSTGAAAALVAAAAQPGRIGAVVSRGGRPDLAPDSLARVRCPVLLLVGSLDTEVLFMNREAARRMPSAEVGVVDGATHLFPERGALEAVALRAREWFSTHLKTGE